MVSGRVKQVVSYTVAIVWEFAWADSGLVVLEEWSSYRGGRLTGLTVFRKNAFDKNQ